jgi:hypothetical protein
VEVRLSWGWKHNKTRWISLCISNGSQSSRAIRTLIGVVEGMYQGVQMEK